MLEDKYATRKPLGVSENTPFAMARYAGELAGANQPLFHAEKYRCCY
jgi:hypothetical protein